MQRKLNLTGYSGFLLLIFILSIISRFLFLENKPVHFDEGINGWFVMQMKLNGFYKYDPTNYHGPLYFYLLGFIEFILGRTLTALRAVPSIFAVLSVVVVGLDYFSTRKMRAPLVLFLLLSPAFIFYGRSGIHEMPFVFFQLLWGMGLCRWLEGEKDSKAFALVITGLWGMMLLKETFAITVFAWGVAFLTAGWAEVRALFLKKTWLPVFDRQTKLLCAVLAVLFVLFFTGFLLNPRGILDFFIAFLPWMKTGSAGNGHEKEFLYWTKVLWEAEPVALVGGVAAILGLASRNKAYRAVCVFSLVQFLIYSLIPYKTVWCVLSLVWGFYFALAYALVEWKSKVLRGALIIATVGFGLYQLRSSYESVYRQPINMEHPYIYVNSTYELKHFVEFLNAYLETNPASREQMIQLGMREQWPWPWIFHAHTKLDYNVCGNALMPGALVYFCDLADSHAAEQKFTEPYLKLVINFRQSKESSIVYLRAKEFESIYQGPSLKIDPPPPAKGTP